MRGPRISAILVAANVGMVFAAVASVGLVARGLLWRLADEQAKARVSLAAANAVEAIASFQDDLLRAAELAAARPVLDDSRPVGASTSWAVLAGGKVREQGGPPLPWVEIAAGAPPVDGRFLLRLPSGVVLGARTRAVLEPETTVLAARSCDAELTLALSERVGMPVAILARDQALERGEDPRSRTRVEVLGRVQGAAARLDAAGAYVAIEPLRDAGGLVVGLVEAELSRAPVASSVKRFGAALATLTLLVAALAALASLLLGRRIARPLEQLTAASARIGGGDLASPIPRSGGREAHVLASTMEEMRSRLLRLTAELRRRQAEAEAILTGIAEGVFAVDRERRIVYMNPQAAALLGIRAEEATGRFCGDVLRPRGPDGVRPCEERCPIVDARLGGSARATEYLELEGESQRTVVVTSAAAEPENGPGAPAATRQFQILRDETEIEATRRLRDAVIANVSHEFRTPLSAQLASIELLRERLAELSIDEAQKLLLSLERGALRLARLVDNLLESIRIEAGQSSIRRQRVALDEVVEEAVELTAPLIEQRGQQLVVDLPYPLPAVQGDGPRLAQVFVNLLANANKFAPAGSSITMGGTVEATEITLWVEDQGPGLPPGAGASVFERFARAPGDEPRESGMGLGLWIVKSIVERHRGRVHAASSGSGTRMSVTLPHRDEREDPRR